MAEFFSTDIRKPNLELMEKKKKNVMVTIYGPYGDFENDLSEIGSILQTHYGYIDCKLVSQRDYHELECEDDKYVAEKSFHFLRKSNVLIFIFFCDKRKENRISHSESPAAELTHLIDKISNKVGCCFVLREKGCSMGPVVFGQLPDEIMYEQMEFENNSEIDKIVEAKCRTYLELKFNEIKSI